MFSAVIFILILSFLVLIHELGHFLAARWARIKVEEFGLGYPPTAFKLFTYKGTDFTINWIPFGGFVRMEGEDSVPEVVSAKETKKKSTNNIGPFYEKNAIRRLIVILAGVTVNFLFGIMAFTIVYAFVGIPTQIDRARIAQVMPDSPAAAAHVPDGVEIRSVVVDDQKIPVDNNQSVIDAVAQAKGKTITVITSGVCADLNCADEEHTYQIYVRTQAETPSGEGSLGVIFESVIFHFYPWYEMPFRSIVVGLEQALGLGLMILVTLGQVFRDLFSSGVVPQDLAGPVGIVHQASQEGIFHEGFLMILNFTGLLSINLAIMNLLPIPALDGGRALFIGLEKLIGRHRVARFEGYANYGGFAVLISLIVLITARDIWRIIH